MLRLNVFKFTLLLAGLILLCFGTFFLVQNRYGLGTILPLLIGLIFCIQTIFDQQIRNFLMQRPRLNRYYKIGWTLFSIWLISLCLFFAFLKYQMNKPENIQNIDAIIVLGSGIINGKPSPTLAARLDRAAEVSEEFPKAIFIVSGGLNKLEQHTEAQLMSEYLQENFNIDANRIEQENQSTSTYLNLKNSQKILKEHGLSRQSHIAIVTSDFHSYRASLIAKKQGYQNIISISAATPLITRYNSWIREYFAYISDWALGEY